MGAPDPREARVRQPETLPACGEMMDTARRGKRMTGNRTLLTIAVLVLTLPCMAAAQRGGSVITGQVLGLGGDPVGSALVDALDWKRWRCD